jgi:hypothetical protein
MSSVVIAGDTSGTVTLQAPAVAGSTVLSLPSSSGTILTTAGGTATTATNVAGGVAGNVPYQTGVGTTGFVTNGTSGQVLQSNGASAPSWVTPATGAMTLISTQTASSSASLSWTGLSGYDKYLIIFSNLVPASNTAFQIQLGTGSTTYVTTGYWYAGYFYQYAVGSIGQSGNNSAAFYIAGAYQSSVPNAYSGVSGTINIAGFTSGSDTSILSTTTFMATSAASVETDQMNGILYGNSTTKTAIRILANTGNITSGKASLYGIS